MTGPSVAPFTITTGNCIGPDAVSPMVMKPWARSPGSAATPRILTPVFIAERSRNERLRATRRDRAVGRREAADAVGDLLRRRVTVRDAQMIRRVRNVRAREELAAGQHRDAAVRRRPGDAVAVDVLGKRQPHIVAALRNLE